MSDKDVVQNLPGIKYISAPRTGSIDAVLDTMRRCEALTLTPQEKAMASDIAQSVNEHGEQSRTMAAYYLVRYGMLLEREKAEQG